MKPKPSGAAPGALARPLQADPLTGVSTWQRKSPDSSNCRFRPAPRIPSPPIGPALGQRGLNIMEFCKAFNAQTQKMEKGAPIPVVITIYADRSFTFEMKTPPMSHFLKKAAKIESGSKTPGRGIAGSVTKAQVKEIAETEDEGPQLRHHRRGHADGRRLGAVDGSGSDGVRTMASTENARKGPRRRRPHQALSARRGGEDGQGARQGEVR